METELITQDQLPYFDQYYKHNDYIQNFELTASMDIGQHRVFDTLMSCLQTLSFHKQEFLFKSPTGEKRISMNLDFFMKRYLKAHNIKSIKKSEIKTAIKSLVRISVLKETERGFAAVAVFPYANADLVNNNIEIEISKHYSYDTLIPTKLDNKSPGYTKLFNSKQVELKSVYARILYQYFVSLLAFKKSITKKLLIEDLQKILGFLDENGKFIKGKKAYKDLSQFKRRCIKDSVDSINSNTDIFIEFIDVKSGRKIIGFDFTIGFKIKEKTETSPTPQLLEFTPKFDQFKNKDEFVKYMKINYKNQKITNNVEGYPPTHYLVIDNNGLLMMEKEDGIYNFEKDNSKAALVAIRIWEWLYKNINKVGNFDQVSKIDDLNFIYKNIKIDINDIIYEVKKIEKGIENWIIIIDNSGKLVTIEWPLTKNISEFLNSKRITQ
jgi:plasmid replication initiation protein